MQIRDLAAIQHKYLERRSFMHQFTANTLQQAQPLVSVGIPTYNRPEGLRHTLLCITGQTYANLEIIVSNNASPRDETEQVVKAISQHDNRIKYFRQPVNIGATPNFKFVLNHAKGKYFMWFADDDSCDATFISELVSCLELNSDIALAMCDVQIIEDATSKTSDVRLSSIRLDKIARHWEVARKHFFAYPTSNIFFCIYGLYRTEILKRCKINFVSKWKGITFASEVPVLAQIASQGKIVSLPKILKTYISHSESMYVKERGQLNWFDRMVRHIEIRVALTWIAIQSGLKLRDRMVLGFWPWMSCLY
jgi:glycosyltransferase domain-containing protein